MGENIVHPCWFNRGGVCCVFLVFIVLVSCKTLSLQYVTQGFGFLGQDLVRMVVEPCVLCHVRIECLGVLGRGIYILGVCMGGAMREWYCQVHYGLCLCLLMFDIL